MVRKHQFLDLYGKTVFERVVFDPPFKVPGSMENGACFIFPISGSSSVYSEMGAAIISADEGAFMKCGRYINKWHKRNDKQSNDVVAIHLYPQVLRKVFKDGVPEFLNKKKELPKKNIFIVKREEAVSNFIHGLIFYFENPQLTNEEFMKLKLIEFLIILYNTGSQGLNDMLADIFDERKFAFKEIIRANLYRPLSVEDLAFLTNMSLSSFKRKFREVYLEPPAKYIREQRLIKAAELLKNSDKSISEISYDTGFNDPKLFARNFKQRNGCAPSAYRLNNLN